MEAPALFTFAAGGVVGTVTHQLLGRLVGDAAGGMAVAFAASANSQISYSVRETFLSHTLVVCCGFVQFRVQAVQNYHDVSGRHPVLQHRRGVEVTCRRATLQGTEGDPWRTRDGHGIVEAEVGVGAKGFLLVSLTNHHATPSAVHLPALGREELEGDPGVAIVHGLVDGEGVRLLTAKLEADVREFVLLAQRERESHVVGVEGVVGGRVPAG